MDQGRIKMLQEYAKEDPDDPFPPYALALELLPTDPLQAKELFDKVLLRHPGYLPVYYHAGHYYITAGNTAKASMILEAGIALAASTGDLKTRAELQSLVDTID